MPFNYTVRENVPCVTDSGDKTLNGAYKPGKIITCSISTGKQLLVNIFFLWY